MWRVSKLHTIGTVYLGMDKWKTTVRWKQAGTYHVSAALLWVEAHLELAPQWKGKSMHVEVYSGVADAHGMSLPPFNAL